MVTRVRSSYYEVDFDKLKKSILVVIKNLGNKGIWPPRKGTNSAIYSPFLAEDLLRITRSLSLEELVSIKSPTLVWKLLLTSITGMRIAGWGLDKRTELANSLLNVAFALKEDDFYYEKGTNKLKNFKIEKKEEISTNESRYLKALMWMHQEALFYNFHNIGLEIHGPYEQDGKKYLIYDYSNFNPPWADYNKFKVKDVRIVSEFDDLEIFIDAVGNYYGRSLSEPISSWINVDKFPKREFEANLEKLMRKTSEMSAEQLFEREKEIVWFSIKPWKDLLKEDWHPPKVNYSKEKAVSFRITNLDDFFDLRKEVK